MRYEALYPRACDMADLLSLLPGVVDVALSGSTARKEIYPSDIDFVVFHDGSVPDHRISFNKGTLRARHRVMSLRFGKKRGQ